MTWTKLSDDFAVDARVLSDAAFRTHVEGLLWAMARETGGYVDGRDVKRFAETDQRDDAVQELVDHGFWRRVPDGFQIAHHMQHQPEPEVLAARRASDAERQARRRRKAAGLADPTPLVSRRDSPRDDPRDPGRVGSGRDGTGAREQEDHNNSRWAAPSAAVGAP